MATRPIGELRDVLMHGLAARPQFLMQVEFYEDDVWVRSAASPWRLIIGRKKYKFAYGNACVHCEMLRILAEVEAAAGAAGAAGVTESYRQRLRVPPKFIGVFRPRFPTNWWDWGWDAAASIRPNGVCADHRQP